MAFIRLKQERKGGKIYPYYYFCIRRRSGKRDGGDGKVKSPDKLIGRYLLGRYLAFWLWDGLPVKDYIEAFIDYRLKSWRIGNYIQWAIAWKEKKSKVISAKLSIRAKYENGKPLIDARSSDARKVKQYLQEDIEEILHLSNVVAEKIKETAYHLACYQYYKKALEKSEAEYSDWLSNPDKEFWIDGRPHVWADDAGDAIQNQIEILKSLLDSDLRWHQSGLEALITYPPPSEKKRFKAAIIHQTEKLASSPNFIDRYKTEKGWGN
jgi:hypothetical protein